MPRHIDNTGLRFGRLTAIERRGQTKAARWLCVCDCGNEKVVASAELRRTKDPVRSCGCLWKTHGHTVGHKLTPEYNTWVGMVQRCTDSNHEAYANYGGAGISVYPEWLGKGGFARFLAYLEATIGHRPEGMTLDRINPHGNYEPGNIQWADRIWQRKNRRCS